MRRLPVAALVVVALVVGAPTPAVAREPVTYRPPVDAPVTDRFRPPSTPYAAGNRGVDYAAEPGQVVAAAADGEVVFAGQVAGDLHVVVLHADGLRTSYSFLASVSVRRGDRVRAGQPVGTAGGPMHLGARAGDTYLDPLQLFGGRPVEVRLVPLEDRKPRPPGEERRALTRFLGGVRRAVGVVGAAGLAWARSGTASVGRRALVERDALAAWLSVAHSLGVPSVVRVAAAVRLWADQRAACTPAGEAPPPPTGRRLVVLVAGLASSGPVGGSIFDLDTEALGYAAADVTRFSYRGGDATLRPYGPLDTQVDIAVSAARLRALLDDVSRRHPGVPIDVVAHSQGGLVARAALSGAGPDRPDVETLVTLATPHSGASIATAGVLAGTDIGGQMVLAAADRVAAGGIRPGSPSVGQLAEGSPFLRDLARRPLPSGTRVVSVAGRYDVIVPSVACLVPGAANVTVTVDGSGPLQDHDALPRSAAARREIALAIADRAPTCQSLADAAVDAGVGVAIDQLEDAAAVSLVAALP